MLYDDGRIACDDASLVIRWYYPWGAKTIPYSWISPDAPETVRRILTEHITRSA